MRGAMLPDTKSKATGGVGSQLLDVGSVRRRGECEVLK